MTTSKQRKAKAREEEFMKAVFEVGAQFIDRRLIDRRAYIQPSAAVLRDELNHALMPALPAENSLPLVELPRGFRTLLKAK